MENRHLCRAKNTHNHTWMKGYLVRIMYKSYIVSYGGVFSEVDPTTICHCTGRRDKDGKLIWENDIVIVPSNEEPCLLGWEDGDGCWSMEQDGTVYTFDNFWSNEVEVIGNKFDNAELLEV